LRRVPFDPAWRPSSVGGADLTEILDAGVRVPPVTVRRRPGPARALTAFVAAAAVVALGAAPLGAQTTGDGSTDPVAALRQQADQASTAYFAALDHYQTITAQIAALQAQLPGLQAEEAARSRVALARAVAAYESAGSEQLGALMGSANLLAAAQQVEWLTILNGQDLRALTALHQTESKLRADEKSLQSAQQGAAGALSALQAQSAAIEAKLTAAQTQANQQAAAAAAAPQGGAGGGGASAPAGGGNPNYTPSPGENPHHNDPFLVCTRDRESGGNYGAVNPAGPYMGAYQFLQSTWDSTANHAGRTSLIGVPPNTASAYDQDDIAWDLYQWQGAGPWGGRCA
jgi:Transglycosylase-like domain